MNHHFQVNLGGIIDLLSNHLYSGPEVFMRELLQNAVDAIHAREKVDPSLTAEIQLELIRSRKGAPPALVISDTGIGLTEDEIHRFLATIGESSKRGLQGERLADFIGQFGIGLLSCFMVSDEIAVVTRSAKGDDSPTLEWRGKADGTYTVKTLESSIAPGTQVYLTCKPGSEDYFEYDRLLELARYFGGLLPYPIRLVTGNASELVNADVPPWRAKFASSKERARACLAYGMETFGQKFFDAIPLDMNEVGVEGMALVLNFSPNATAQTTHRVYLKNMFLSEQADNLLPPWAVFVKLLVNTNRLKPTASRQGFQEDAALEETRAALGRRLRRFLVELSEHDPDKLAQLIAIHELTILALAVADDDFYRIVLDWLPIETSQGRMTLGEYRSEHETLMYAATVDQFRQISQVAAAQQMCVINGGYTYLQELFEKYPLVFPDGQVQQVEARDIVQNFADLDDAEQDLAEAFLRQADTILRPFRCTTELKKFVPEKLATVFTTSPDGQFMRSVEQSKDIANPLWSSLLDNVAPKVDRGSPLAELCFNFNNPLVRRLVAVENPVVLRRSIQVLYLQSLLMGHHPLSSKEMNLLNESMTGLVDLALDTVGET